MKAGTAGPIEPVSTRVMNLSHFVTQAARRFPERIGFVRGDKSWTWREIDRRIDAMSFALAEIYGVKKGDRVLVQSQNCNQMFESMFACFRIGAIWVPTNFRQTPEEVSYQAEASGAVGMICGNLFAHHQSACAASSAPLRFFISIGASAFGPDYDTIVSQHDGRPVETAAVDRDDPCWFLFTSGTTGRPKAAVLTHGQMAFVITNHLCDLMPGTTEEDASLVVAPLSHGAGVHQLTQVARGAKTVLLATDRFDIDAAWALIEKWRITNVFTVPTILKMLVEHPAVDRYDHSSLRHVIYAGAPMYRTDQEQALTKLGPVLVQYFGLGEVTGNITVLPPNHHRLGDGAGARIGTCGFERTGMQVAIKSPDGKERSLGETGEICVIGPAVFVGYFNNPEANAKAFLDGWFRTGDVGHMDSEGFLYITGRASDMYISGGSNIYPREIEEKILTLPGIGEVAVLGVPDPIWGEIGVAVCVAAPGTDVATLDVDAWLQDKIARYKLPKRYVFWSELPKSGYGKVAKKAIRDLLASQT
ncbi:acyl-CoA synthetase [Mesorhizobium qingshengii]|uniref:Acyl-CoA synthetase (AMP-forming)/AMP-acid ligase II n=1 Tax=Mesorhizobium qingshengii TaxID=1165689 RepID=A0A1G5ZCI0_9HYPH|nr:acyl-CoA synthetase [Mesorhizobium qingshengii]SDA92571.1 Acyl-CoA synthetase (AMP-forming)/AMP-acid ligase II [Mesorhizobium qingshengii]